MTCAGGRAAAVGLLTFALIASCIARASSQEPAAAPPSAAPPSAAPALAAPPSAAPAWAALSAASPAAASPATSSPAAASPAASPAAARRAAAALRRNLGRCRRQANLDACYDAVRWNPSDPPLLIALGDALMRARRPADALRSYRRAAELAPALHGVGAKIAAAEAKLAPRRQGSRVAHAAPLERPQASNGFSNDAPETRSH